jgi:biotin carboxyl carrier protein
MKSYKITVNGQSYDVTVEEVGAGAPPGLVPRPASAAPVSSLPSAPKPAPAAGSGASAGATLVKAPMPGTLLGYKVAKGQTVKRGEVLVILEAMKMENEIVSPVDGVVTALGAAEGSAVSTGDLLIELA